MSELSGQSPKPWWSEMGIDPDMPFTAEDKAAALKAFELFRPKMGNSKGIIVVFGTSGSIEDGGTFKDMFYQPDSYGFK